MAFEEMGKPRHITQKTASGLIISIPSKKNWFIILFLGFWLIGWAMGEISVITILAAGIYKWISGEITEIMTIGTGAFSGLFMIAWLGGWTVGGAFAIYTWLWQIRGVEKITISTDSFQINKKIPLWTRSKKYHLHNVISLRVSASQPSMWNRSAGMEFWGISGGRLAFDYGAKTVKFGAGIDEAEATLVLNEIKERYPQIVKDK